MKGMLILCFILVGLTACEKASQPDNSPLFPPCLQNPTKESFQFMRGVIELSQKEDLKRKSSYLEAGEEAEIYEEWLDIFPMAEGRYRETSLYNVYEQGDSREYYVQLMELDTNNQEKRAVRDLQFRVTPDTAFPTLSDATFLRYTGKSRHESFSNAKIDLFLLEGYEHPTDIEYGQLKWWSPQLGTVLIWYGEERYFQMAEWAPSPLNTTELERLIASLKQQTTQKKEETTRQ